MSLPNGDEYIEEKNDDVEARNQERRDRNPLAYCQFIVNHPKMAFGKYSLRFT